MFPQLIAGPIVRYASIDEQLQQRTITMEDVAYGIRRFTVGLGKKLLIANYMGIAADNLFGMTGALSTMAAWYGVICYAFQIYFDFSGYSDMAIGLGRMFGFHFDENFRYPYTAQSVSDFWRRWHISLSTWFRDYVYIPLGGNRVSTRRWVLNYFIVWMLTGIWHGANLTFFLWGFYYFVLLTLEKLTGIQKRLGPAYRFATLLFILLGWVLFRSDNLGMAQQYLHSMFTVSANGFADFVFLHQLTTSYPVLILAAVGSTPLCKVLFERLRVRDGLKQGLLAAATVLVFVLSLLVAISSTHNPFLYFNF
jgi:alginate O-acetyltransferase complex protein AlgI